MKLKSEEWGGVADIEEAGEASTEGGDGLIRRRLCLKAALSGKGGVFEGKGGIKGPIKMYIEVGRGSCM